MVYLKIQIQKECIYLIIFIRINIQFIRHEDGKIFNVKGRVGDTLLETAINNNIEVGGIHFGNSGAPVRKIHSSKWTEDLFGEGPVSNASQVYIANEYLHKLPNMQEEEKEIIDEIYYVPKSPKYYYYYKLK